MQPGVPVLILTAFATIDTAIEAIREGAYDYLVLFLTAFPFLTGFFAYHQWFDYKTVITLHMLAGEAMLIAIPFSKIGHMIYFFFVRLLIGSEFGPARGSREWKV